MGFVGTLFACISALLHVAFFYLESIAFVSNKKVQKLFLGRDADNETVFARSRVSLFNQGFYNLFLALSTFYGIYTGNTGLVKCMLMSYVGAGAVLLYSSSKMWRGAAAQIVPATIALLTL